MQYEVKSGCAVFELSAEIVRIDSVKEIITDIEQDNNKFQSLSVNTVLLDLTKANSLAVGVFPLVFRLMSILNQVNLKFGIIGNSKISQQITKQGLEKMIPFYQNMDAFTNKGAGANHQRSLEFLNTMLESVKLTIDISLETNVKVLKPEKLMGSTNIDIHVGAVAGLLSNEFNGNMIIAFSRDVFLKTMNRFLQSDFTEITPPIRDGAAELLNVIIGQTKIRLNEKGFEIKQVIPTVISGEKINLSPTANQSALLIPFEVDFGRFDIILTTTQSKALI